MAENVDTGLLPRTYFKAPRVPFDFRALALAMLGYLVYWGGSLLLAEIFSTNVTASFLEAAVALFKPIPFIGVVVQEFLRNVFERGGGTISSSFWDILVGGAWIFVVWAYFAQAIHRITSLRIARDEGLSFMEAFRFSAKNWVTVILAPVIIAATMGFFYGCNALAGIVGSIPWIGQFLALILVPLAVLSTLLILLIALGGIFGLPLIGAAAAWERNGSLDAISRAFSYIFARPLQFFWNYFLIFLFVGVILLVGRYFIFTLTKSIDAGVVWSDELSVMIDAPPQLTIEGSDYEKLNNDAKDLYVRLREKTGYRPESGAPTLEGSNNQPFARDIHVVAESPWSQKLNALIFWVALNLIWLGVLGYAIYWFFGATTSVYADLRADVDGTEEDEIYLEEEEEDFDALADAAGRAEPETPPAELSTPPPAETEATAPESAPPAPESPPPETETPPEAPKPDEEPPPPTLE